MSRNNLNKRAFPAPMRCSNGPHLNDLFKRNDKVKEELAINKPSQIDGWGQEIKAFFSALQHITMPEGIKMRSKKGCELYYYISVFEQKRDWLCESCRRYQVDEINAHRFCEILAQVTKSFGGFSYVVAEGIFPGVAKRVAEVANIPKQIDFYRELCEEIYSRYILPYQEYEESEDCEGSEPFFPGLKLNYSDQEESESSSLGSSQQMASDSEDYHFEGVMIPQKRVKFNDDSRSESANYFNQEEIQIDKKQESNYSDLMMQFHSYSSSQSYVIRDNH